MIDRTAACSREASALSVDNVHDLPATAKSYVYTRLAVLVVIAGLAVSIGIERWLKHVQLDSISAYYFTPVHSLFIGALVALSAVMIALRSDDDLEDMLLNVAGALAAVVAFVPSAKPAALAGSSTVVVDADALIRNNMIALLSALALVVVVAIAAAARAGRRSAIVPTRRSNWVGLVLSSVLIAAGAVWYWLGRASFLRSAHYVSATLMFVLIFADVIVNGWRTSWLVKCLRRLIDPEPDVALATISDFQQLQYRLIAAWMVGGALVAFGLGGAARVFWIEAVEIAGFVAFWIVQTGAAVSHANAGVAQAVSPTRRDQR